MNNLWQRIPSTIDYFINTLEEAFQEFSRVILTEKNISKIQTSDVASPLRSKTPFIANTGSKYEFTITSDTQGQGKVNLFSPKIRNLFIF